MANYNIKNNKMTSSVLFDAKPIDEWNGDKTVYPYGYAMLAYDADGITMKIGNGEDIFVNLPFLNGQKNSDEIGNQYIYSLTSEDLTDGNVNLILTKPDGTTDTIEVSKSVKFKQEEDGYCFYVGDIKYLIPTTAQQLEANTVAAIKNSISIEGETLKIDFSKLDEVQKI